ncbi:MAG: polymer-forming cytoskeletal protein [Pontixanthobacter sp.]
MGGNSTFSVIGTDVTITGDIHATTELHVDGRIEGDIACASIVQGDDSVINGAVTAESARLAGTLNGSISARELVVLKSAKIYGDVHYEALTIEQGAVVEGRFSAKGIGSPNAADEDTKTMSTSDEPKLTIAN